MARLEDVIRRRYRNLSQEDVDGVKSRLVFAGLDTEVSADLNTDLMDRVVEKMQSMKKNMVEYAEKTSTVPKADYVTAGDNEITVALVNGRVVRFNPQNNVAMPLKKRTKSNL